VVGASRSRRSSGARRASSSISPTPDTNVVLTRFLDADGVAEVSDFMPVEDARQAHRLVRRAKTVRGRVRFQMRCDPRFDYARATHTAERRNDTEVLFIGRSGDGELVLRLRSSVAMRLENGAALAEFMPDADAKAWFVLEVVLPNGPSPSAQPDYESDAFKQTVDFSPRRSHTWPSSAQPPISTGGSRLPASPGDRTHDAPSSALLRRGR
jgi:hypothetical protein